MSEFNFLNGYFIKDIPNNKLENWKKEYENNSYLKGASKSKIFKRIDYLLNNFVIFSITGNPQCWKDDYFLEKLVHIHEELQKRKTINIDKLKKEIKLEEKIKKVKSIANKVKEIETPSNPFLVKYSKKEHIQKLIKQGEVYFNNAKNYKEGNYSSAIKDDEDEYTEYSGESHIATLKNNNRQVSFQTPEINMKQKLTTDYLTYCLTLRYSPRLFDAFNRKACAIIAEPNEFLNRLNTKLDEELNENEWMFTHRKVSYYDPCVSNNKGFSNKEKINIPFQKELKYKYQNEYRAVLVPYTEQENLEPIKLKIGSLEDICKVIYLN